MDIGLKINIIINRLVTDFINTQSGHVCYDTFILDAPCCGLTMTLDLCDHVVACEGSVPMICMSLSCCSMVFVIVYP